MSWRVANKCSKRRFGSAVRKQIIMFIADKASDDGSGIWCSKGTIQRQTELGGSTVKRTISDFLREGVLIETGQKKCKNGYTVEYQIVLAQIALLKSTAEPEIEVGSAAARVLPEPGTGAMMDGVPGPQRTPNRSVTFQKPPTRKREGAGEGKAEEILGAYPKDRIRGKVACLEKIEDALSEGFTSKDMLEAVKTYAIDSAGYTRSKVCFSDNWFRTGRWREQIEDIRTKRAEAKVVEAENYPRLTSWIMECDPRCRLISEPQLQVLLESNLVTASEVQAAGLKS